MYQKQNFVKGQKLKAEEMNHIEDGIVAVEKSVKDLEELASAGGIHIGPDAPVAGEQKVWIDTDEGSPDVDDPEEESKPGIDVIAKPGQVIAVKTVGEDSKPTRFKAVDLPIPEKPNWNANEGQPGYIEGRTHFVDGNGVVHKLNNKFIDADWMATSQEHIDHNVFILEQKLTSGMWSKLDAEIQPGLMYDVHINGVIYPCEAFGEDGGICIGNNTSLTKNNLPFCIYWAGGSARAGFFYKNSTLEYPLYMKVTGHSWTEYNKLPEEFLPDGVVKSVNGSAPDASGNVTVEIPESTGGGVDVTASVGQTIIVEEVDAEGKPTKWKAADYQPRTHWTEEIEIQPEVTFETDPEDGVGVFAPDFVPKSGVEYAVTYNGTRYVCTTFSQDGEIGFGNMTGVTDDGTGEPFLCAYSPDEGMIICEPFDGSTSVTLSIKEVKHTPIPVQYMTNALPYYIVLTGSGTDDDPYVFNRTYGEVMAAFNSGREIKLRASDSMGITFYNLTVYYHARIMLFVRPAQGTTSSSYIMITVAEDGSTLVKYSD